MTVYKKNDIRFTFHIKIRNYVCIGENLIMTPSVSEITCDCNIVRCG